MIVRFVYIGGIVDETGFPTSFVVVFFVFSQVR